MKYLNLFIITLIVTLLTSSCTKQDNSNEIERVGIRVINATSYNFKNLKFVLYNQDTISFESIKKGKTTDYEEFDSLRYSFYNESHDEVFFSYYYTAIVDGKEIHSFKGFCGTGLTTKTTDKGLFSVLLSNVNMDKKTFIYTEKKEE